MPHGSPVVAHCDDSGSDDKIAVRNCVARAGSLQLIHPMLRTWVVTTLNLIGAFAAPAAVINAVKAVFTMTKDRQKLPENKLARIAPT